MSIKHITKSFLLLFCGKVGKNTKKILDIIHQNYEALLKIKIKIPSTSLTNQCRLEL